MLIYFSQRCSVSCWWTCHFLTTKTTSQFTQHSCPLLPPLPRCVMKMDHHCPWINNCCGHLNHAYFTSFLLLAPMGCSHAAIIFIMTMYTQLYERVSLLTPHTPPHHAFDGLLFNTAFLWASFILACHTDFTTQIKLFSFSLTADIIWLEHRQDWHECCASISAAHAVQYACLCCHTLCLRFGTGHHYCRWHAFLHTGTFFLRFSLVCKVYRSWTHMIVVALTLQSQTSVFMKQK